MILTSYQGYNPGRQETWLEALLFGLGAEMAPGVRDVRLPAAVTVQISAQGPDDQPRGAVSAAPGRRTCWWPGALRGRACTSAGSGPRGRPRPRHWLASARRGAVRPARHLAATAVAEYAECGAGYRWAGELGVEEAEPPSPLPGGLSPQAWGAAGHRAMELATSPAPEATAAAVAGAVREVQAAADARPELERRLREALQAFWASPLGGRVAGAQRARRELPVLLQLDAAEIRGTIDLVFQGPDGRWELVDYKSSGPSPDEAPARARKYELQLGLYALAASRWLRAPIDRWSVFFLGSAAAAEHAVTEADLGRIEQRRARRWPGWRRGDSTRRNPPCARRAG